MNDIEPMRPASETQHRGFLGLLRELGLAYIGAIDLAAEGGRSLYEQCVARGEKTVGELQVALEDRGRHVRSSRRQRAAEQSADLAAHASRQVQFWLARDGRVTRAQVARLTEQIDELERQLEALDKEEPQP